MADDDALRGTVGRGYGQQRTTRLNISHSASMTVSGRLTLGDLRAIADAEGIPDDAAVDIGAPSNDPREGSSRTVRLTW